MAVFPRRGRAVFKVVNHTIELIFFFYMIPFAWLYMMSCGIPMYYIQAAPLAAFVMVAFQILQRWIIEFRIAKGENVYDPAHPERNTPESFIEANIKANQDRSM